jgi:hypothetical protein
MKTLIKYTFISVITVITLSGCNGHISDSEYNELQNKYDCSRLSNEQKQKYSDSVTNQLKALQPTFKQMSIQGSLPAIDTIKDITNNVYLDNKKLFCIQKQSY